MAAWLSGFTKRFPLSVDAGKVTADLSNFTIPLRLADDAGINSADLTELFDDLGAVTDGEYKIAVTLADGTTQIAVEIAKWDWTNEIAHLYVGPIDVSASSDLVLYLYWDAAHAGNHEFVGDAWRNDPTAVWDSSHLLVNHMADGPALTEIEDELSGLPTDPAGSAVWQGVAVDEDGGSWYLISSEGPSGPAGAPVASSENVIRKYGIVSKTEETFRIGYGPEVDFKFSTGAVIDSRIYVTVRSNLGAEPETWARVVSYNLPLTLGVSDQDVAFGGYTFPEGVAKHSIDGTTTYWWVMFGGRGDSGTANGKKCVLVRYDYPGWGNPVAYELFDSIPAGRFGLQDIKWISDTDFIGTIHNTGPSDRRGYVEQWHWNGSGFNHVRRWAVPVDSGVQFLGQGLVDLVADPLTWYLAGRHSDRLVECKMDSYETFGSFHCPDSSPNTDKPDGLTQIATGSITSTTSPTQQTDELTGYKQDFDFASSEYLDCGDGANLNPADAFTIKVVISVDTFQAADGGRNTLVYLQRGIYLQVRGDGANANKVAVYLTGAGDAYWFSRALATGTRYHLVVTWDGATVRLRIDGVEDTAGDFPVTQAGTITYTAADHHGIGAELSGAADRFFDGQIMEVGVMDDAKSDAWALADFHGLEDNLITWAALESNILAATTTFALAVPEPTVEVEVVADEDVPLHFSDAAHTFLTGQNLAVGYVSGAGAKNAAFAVRFRGVQIPQGAKIRSAYIRFEAALSLAEVDVNGRVDGLAADDSSTPAHAEFDGGSVGAANHGRASANRTSAQVLWSLIGGITAGENYNTPDIKAITQEIISRPLWVEGNAMTYFIGDEDHESDQIDDHYRAFTRNVVPVLVVIYTEAPVEYTILLRDSDTLNLLSELPTYRAATWRRHDIESGEFSIQTHLEFIEDVDHIRGKRIVEIRRDGAFEFAGKIEVVKFDELTKLVTIAGPDLKGYWLSLRDINPGGSEFDTQTGVAGETAMKHYVEDHLTSPSVAARNVNFELDGIDFTVEGDGLRGSDVDYNARWVNLLAALIDLARAADVLHDVVLKTAYTGYEYRVSSPVDATEDTGLVPVIFSADWENVGQLVYREDFSSVINAITMLGTGSGAARNTEEVTDPVSIAADYRREGHKDERQADTAAKLAQQGTVAIAQSLFDAVTADTEPLIVGPTLYREQWDLGYDVTLSLVSLGVKVDRRIVEVKVSLDEQNMETIEIALGASQVGFVRAVVEALRKANPAQVE